MPRPTKERYGHLYLSRYIAWLEVWLKEGTWSDSAQVVYFEDNVVLGTAGVVIVGGIGLRREFRTKDSFEPGIAFMMKVTLLAKGAIRNFAAFEHVKEGGLR